jgi:hypothetical protein
MNRYLLAAVAAVVLAAPARGQTDHNLLRNADFQDDFLTLLPENKNHHWCYSSEFYNRRDYNPDGWACKGSWQWLDADKPMGQRRLVLTGPAEIVQRVNWVLVHDDRSRAGFPDAGGFPAPRPQRSLKPLRVVRSLIFYVRLSGQDVPADAGTIEVGLCPAGGVSDADPYGTVVPPTAQATTPLPPGTYPERWIEVRLDAAAWLKAAQEAADKGPKEKAEAAKSGTLLPGTVRVAIVYKGKTGRVALERALLKEFVGLLPDQPNLLPDGGFEGVDETGYPRGWEKPVKYRYFPPAHYYIFNTWHNANFDNRGPVTTDTLLPSWGRRSLKMIVPAGDEKAVASAPVVLNQKEPRLIEVQALVKTDRLCMLQIDAVDDQGRRLDGFDFVNKSPLSIGSDDWRLVRQVFRPREPVKSLRLLLCARGVNGYTLGGVGPQAQGNAVGTVWWDEVSLHEPESTRDELEARGCKIIPPESPFKAPAPAARLIRLDMGERLLGENVLTATLKGQQGATFRLLWEVTSPTGKAARFESKPLVIPIPQRKDESDELVIALPYTLTEPCPAYTEYRGRLTLLDGAGKKVADSELWFSTWTTPLDLKLGALYLRPEQKQFVRMNFGLTSVTLAKLAKVRLEVVRRGGGQVLQTIDVPATPAVLAAQRDKVPADLRDDLTNLLLADLDVSALPIQPFADPQRNWFVRASALTADNMELARADSPPFCRQAHEPAQPAVQTVAVKGDLLYVNDRPWLPWGVAYGHNPVYAGPADPGPGKYRDLRNLPAWSIYDRHNSASTSRKENDFNCLRYVAGAVADPKALDTRWQADNLLCSTAFAVPAPVWSLDELYKGTGGKDKLDAWLAWSKKAPMVVSVAPGIEEAFGLFHTASPQQRKGLEQVVAYLRQQSGRPVMLGHGGYWNRLELERAPFFDIYDPETEPLFPANLHTDLRPLLLGKDKVVWLRPQMYESVPYERWRFHTFVELMRGARGWQIAHGPGDASLFRGLHGEIELLRPVLASRDAGPEVRVEPWLEHLSRRHEGKTYILAATTHGVPLGRWRDGDDAPPGGRRCRVSGGGHELRDEANAYGIGGPAERGPSAHGIQYLPDARAWPKGSKLVQWVKLDAATPPQGLLVLLKADGRWTHAASWGKADLAALRQAEPAYWFLNTFYRHAKGFLGWGKELVPAALEYVPERAADLGALPERGQWVKVEVPLEKVGAAGKLLDGVGFLHADGQVAWGRTLLVDADGAETLVWGDTVELPPEKLAAVKVRVAGLKAGVKVRVLFEDRELTAQDGFFVDDFRGQDLYQRYGGGWGTGYGDAPVALHVYEVAGP